MHPTACNVNHGSAHVLAAVDGRHAMPCEACCDSGFSGCSNDLCTLQKVAMGLSGLDA